MSVHFTPILDALHTSSDVHDRLSITSVAPVSICSEFDTMRRVQMVKQHSLRGG